MSDPASPLRFTVLLPDGRSFGPADASLLSQWAREGRIPTDAFVQSSDGAPPTRASDIPELRAFFNAPPTVGGPLAAPPSSAGNDGGISYLIPFRNGWALAAYYVGVFALIPIIGLLLGPLAFVFGVIGLRHASAHKNAHGRVHAIVGIVLGILTIVGHVVLFVVLRRFK
jgi:hypothetical protein